MTRGVRDGVTAAQFDGVILIAHGARDARWLEPFARLRAEISRRLDPCKVKLSFMEFAPPSLADAALELSREGAARVLVVPDFSLGGRPRRPGHSGPRRGRKGALSGMTFEMAGALGEEPEGGWPPWRPR